MANVIARDLTPEVVASLHADFTASSGITSEKYLGTKQNNPNGFQRIHVWPAHVLCCVA